MIKIATKGFTPAAIFVTRKPATETKPARFIVEHAGDKYKVSVHNTAFEAWVNQGFTHYDAALAVWAADNNRGHTTFHRAYKGQSFIYTPES